MQSSFVRLKVPRFAHVIPLSFRILTEVEFPPSHAEFLSAVQMYKPTDFITGTADSAYLGMEVFTPPSAALRRVRFGDRLS